jgi:hypothetical protein
MTINVVRHTFYVNLFLDDLITFMITIVIIKFIVLVIRETHSQRKDK